MNNTSLYQFTIVVPVYNERESLAALEQRLADYLPVCPLKACVLLVDDRSTDGSYDIIREICDRNSDFYYVRHTRNLGLSGALKTGFSAAYSEYVGYIDADLQTLPEEFTRLIDNIDGYAMALGIRTGRKDTIHKRLQSKIGNGFRRMMTGDGALDTGCPLKLIRTSYAKRLPMFNGMHRFIPALIMLQEGGSYCQVPVTHCPRTSGKSKFNMWNRLRGFTDCFVFRWMRRNYVDFDSAESNL